VDKEKRIREVVDDDSADDDVNKKDQAKVKQRQVKLARK